MYVELFNNEGMALLPFGGCRDFFIAKTFLLVVTKLTANQQVFEMRKMPIKQLRADSSQCPTELESRVFQGII